ncbi:Sister chromatid cohesion protein 2 [Saitozyma podzolica]|uniref:Sister chromatid cohesion protein n=1 Tax=Saitozyma podzolica TaxID=1890683 RepID=A0A427XZ88_9TREE|nr:Sister chromatid cohesion protein 2 [Saitozyma podzolica]
MSQDNPSSGLGRSSEAGPSRPPPAVALGGGGGGGSGVHVNSDDEPGPYSDPANLTRIYPFATYTPTARVAEHISPHVVTYPTPSSSSATYPQYADYFQRIDNPRSAEDMALRQGAQQRVDQLLRDGGPGYSNPYLPAPLPTAPNFTVQQPQPLPYTFLPSYLPSPTARQPPTPSSLPDTSPPPSSTSATDYFEQFVTNALSRGQPVSTPHMVPTPAPGDIKPVSRDVRSGSVSSVATSSATPTISRRISRMALTPGESPDPPSWNGTGPSPTKKHKTNSHRQGSPTPRTAQTLPARSSSTSSPVPIVPAGYLKSRPSLPTQWRSEPTKITPRTQIVVEIPARRLSVATSVGEDDSPDELDWGTDDRLDRDGDWRMSSTFRSPSSVSYGGAGPRDTGSARTGERDMRTMMQKLQTLLDDIFEESDNFPAEVTLDDLTSSKFFDRISKDGQQPLLSARAITKIIRYVSRVQNSKRKQTAAEEGFFWDEEALKRLFRLLEREMREMETAVPFPEDKRAVANGDKAKKGKKGKGKKGSQSPERESVEIGDDGGELAEDELAAHDEVLRGIGTAGLAAECCLVIFDGEGISKTLYSEDLLSTCVAVVKDEMTKVIFPVMEGLAGEKVSSRYLSHLVNLESAGNTTRPKALSPLFVHPRLCAIAQSATGALPRLAHLIGRPDISFSDGLVIRTVYLSIAPLFVNEPVGKKGRGKDSGKDSASVMKGIRTEALGCLRGASAYGVTTRIRKLRSSAVDLALDGKESKPKTDLGEEEAQICGEMMDSALRSARVVSAYLVKRRTSRETDYKLVLDTFVSDILAVLYRPEWPAASLYLSVFSKLMITAVEDQATGNEAAVAKNIALDYLGDIATKLKTVQLDAESGGDVPSLDQIISEADPAGASRLIKAQYTIHTYLSSATKDDGMFSSALRKTTSVVEKLAAEKSEEAEEDKVALHGILQLLGAASRDIWYGDGGLFEVIDPKQAQLANQASIAVSRGRSLQSAFDPILHALIGALDFSVVGMRAKALRGLSGIVVVDPEILGLSHVRRAFEDRLSDPSPQVRDVAVELVGKYVVQRPHLARDYYPHIAQRVTDSGLGVRKRVVKLLRGIFTNEQSKDIRIDICCQMVILVADQDETVKGLVSMLFPAVLPGGAADAAGLLVDFIGDFKGSNALLEAALREVSRELDASGNAKRAEEAVDALIVRLTDATEQEDFDSLSHIRAISLLCAGQPAVIDTAKATVLLTYLRPPSKADERETNDLLLRIFRLSIPHMPRAASNFATDLTKALLPMISKPSGGLSALKETIGCFCAVTTYLTKDYIRLVTVLRACEGKIRAIRNEYLKTGSVPSQTQAAAMMLYITALIAEHCNLDQIAMENEVVKAELQKIDSHLFDIFLDFARMPIDQNAPTNCLGESRIVDVTDGRFSLPVLPRPHAARGDDAVDAIRIHGTGRGEPRETAPCDPRVSRVGSREEICRSLEGYAGTHREHVRPVRLGQNIEHIRDGAKSHHEDTQQAAMDVLAFTVNQALYHPLACMPILIALETSENDTVADRALELHATLHQKHATLVNVQYLACVKAAYSYQRSITSEVIGHRDGLALLSRWYGLLGEKRAWKHEFLRALCRTFDHDDQKVLQEEVMTVIQALGSVVSTCTPLVSVLEKAQVEGAPTDSIEGKRVIMGDADGDGGKADQLINASIVVCIAMLTKNHLLHAYSLSEDKCLKHIAGKKSVLGDKPAGSDHGGDFTSQQTTFLQLVQEDGHIDMEL